VVYFEGGKSGESGEGGLRKISIEGGDSVQISKDFAVNPAVSPDGMMVAYIRFSTDLVTVVSLTGDNVEQHFHVPFDESATGPLRWSADSRSLLYINSEGGVSNLWSQPISGGRSTQITHFNNDLMRSFDVSRDGKQLVMERGTTHGDVVLIHDVM